MIELRFHVANDQGGFDLGKRVATAVPPVDAYLLVDVLDAKHFTRTLWCKAVRVVWLFPRGSGGHSIPVASLEVLVIDEETLLAIDKDQLRAALEDGAPLP